MPVLIAGPDEFGRAFSEMAKAGAQAVIVQDHFDPYRAVLVELAAKHKLAYMSGTKETAAAGALVSLSPDWSGLYERAAVYVDRILKGAKPETLPVEQATRFQLVLNLKTAKALGLKSRAGAVVVNVVPGGPAAEAGLTAGDVIVRFDNKTVPNDKRLPQIVASTEVGRTVDVVIIRKGQETTVKVKLGELEKSNEAKAEDDKDKPGPPVSGAPLLGMKLSEATAEIKQRFNIRDGEGVVVTEVDAKSQANEKGVKPGDLIVEMDLTKVTKPEEVADLLKKAEQARKTSVLLLVQRGEDRRFVALRIGG